MIWKSSNTGNVYYRSTGELLSGDLVEHENTWYKVVGYNARDERGERPYYWYSVEEVA